MGEILGGQHPRPLSLALLGSSPKGREYGIEEMCADSWNWQKNNPDGYHTVK